MRNRLLMANGGIAMMMSVMVVAAWARAPAVLDAAALQAYAGRPWSKPAMAHSTVELGRFRGVPVVAEFPCADVCPQYTIRIIHYQLPATADCATIGGVAEEVPVPIAITVISKTFCIPEPLVASGQYLSH
jgi:hypothetical protein